jgi:DNA repair protein RadA/Sms
MAKAAKAKITYYCSECGNETIKWQGRCPACGAWNTIVEHKEPVGGSGISGGISGSGKRPVRLQELEEGEESRFTTGIGELDRVLGGGAVRGSLVLVGGAPGIGKSTLLLQLCSCLSPEEKILYVSGEESARQLKMRASRLGCGSNNLYVLIETDLEEIHTAVDTLSPDVLIVDSIQTMYHATLESTPGSVPQVKDCTMALMRLAKESGVTVFIVSHVNKEGAIAGPKVLEHMVDCVLYFEGDSSIGYRILRAVKNRFGSTNEIGVFEMREEGLREVPNPSESLLSGRPIGAAGTCVACAMEGSRPVLAEVQALVTKTNANVPRRSFNGLEFNRSMLLLAVLEKRGGLRISSCDAYINVIGGLRLDEPAADLAAVLAIASSYTDRPISDQMAAIGEVGLAGEIRSVSAMEQRLAEVRRLGFDTCIVPRLRESKLKLPDGLQLIQVKNISEALSAAIGAKRKNGETENSSGT